MENKLALDVLIEWCNTEIERLTIKRDNYKDENYVFIDGKISGIESIINKAKELKQLEKGNIIDAYWGGLNGSINDYTEAKHIGLGNIVGIKEGGGAEQYFNQTYNK